MTRSQWRTYSTERERRPFFFIRSSCMSHTLVMRGLDTRVERVFEAASMCIMNYNQVPFRWLACFQLRALLAYLTPAMAQAS